jgi:hypothetical protein
MQLGSDAPPRAEQPPLLVFATAITKDDPPPPGPGTPGVVWLGPGMHDPNPNISSGWCPLNETHPTLYLAPGACAWLQAHAITAAHSSVRHSTPALGCACSID